MTVLTSLTLLVSLLECVGAGPTAETVHGTLHGYYYSENGTTYANVFTNVPYAQPPIGDRRFEPPDELGVNENADLDASQAPVWCVQFWYPEPTIEKRNMSEDCLRLNIIVPHKPSQKLYPVLIWMHGGSFQVGGGNLFPIRGASINLAHKGIIVVIINYRLGPLGFLSKLRSELPGNYGIEDMLMALKWVQRNIHAFGGNKDKVTLGGESAGAGATSLLAVSPRGVGLFHQAMMRSGSSLAPWAVRTLNTELNSDQLIRDVNCARDDHNIDLIKYCLKHRVTTKQLRDAWVRIGFKDINYIVKAKREGPQFFNHPFLAHTYFTPVEDAFRGNLSIIPDSPRQMMDGGIRMPAMMGVTSGECTNYITWLYYLSFTKASGLSLADLEFVVPQVSFRNSDQVKQAVRERYIMSKNKLPVKNHPKVLIDIASDQNFVVPATIESDLYVKARQPVFVYVFEHLNEYFEQKTRKFDIYDVGSAHGQDMVFIFENTSVIDPQGVSLNWTSSDRLITKILSQTIANFVTTGSPTIKDDPLRWDSYSSECGSKKATFISPNPHQVDFFQDANYFWDKTIPLIDMLRLDTGYRYDDEPFNCLVKSCALDYKLAFYICLALCAVLLLSLSMVCCLQVCARRKETIMLTRI